MPYTEFEKTRIYYQFYKKEGIPLVFIHGWAGNHTKWVNQIEFFSKNYPVIVYDLEGHGKSESAIDYSIRHYSATLHNLLNYLKLDQIYLIGHSLGGIIAQQYAIDYQERIQKLILISTSMKIITSFRKKLAILLMRLLLRVSFKKYFKILFSYTQDPEKSPDKLALLADSVCSISRKVIRNTFAEMTSFNSTDKFSSFDKPTLIILGEKDPIITSQMAQTLTQNIPNSNLKIIPSGYHEIMLENSDLVNEAILNFIEKI